MEKKLNKEQKSLIAAYMQLIVACELNRSWNEQVSENELINAYDLALGLVHSMHKHSVISDDTFMRLCDRLSMCEDCPTTHICTVEMLAEGIPLT